MSYDTYAYLPSQDQAGQLPCADAASVSSPVRPPQPPDMRKGTAAQTPVPDSGHPPAAEKEPFLTEAEVPTVPGYFSLLDKLGEVMATNQGRALFETMLPRLLAATGKTRAPSAATLRFFSGVQLLRLCSMASLMGVAVTREELLEANSLLCRIKKP